MRKQREKLVTEAVPLSMDTIGDLDGGVFRLLVDKEIDALAKDVDDRGEEDGKARILVLNVEVIKVKGMVIITPSVKVKLPPRVSGSTAAKERMKGKGQTELLFQPANGDNPEQPTFQTDESADGSDRPPPKG
jgi:hypothetical protein